MTLPSPHTPSRITGRRNETAYEFILSLHELPREFELSADDNTFLFYTSSLPANAAYELSIDITRATLRWHTSRARGQATFYNLTPELLRQIEAEYLARIKTFAPRTSADSMQTSISEPQPTSVSTLRAVPVEPLPAPDTTQSPCTCGDGPGRIHESSKKPDAKSRPESRPHYPEGKYPA